MFSPLINFVSFFLKGASKTSGLTKPSNPTPDKWKATFPFSAKLGSNAQPCPMGLGQVRLRSPPNLSCSASPSLTALFHLLPCSLPFLPLFSTCCASLGFSSFYSDPQALYSLSSSALPVSSILMASKPRAENNGERLAAIA